MKYLNTYSLPELHLLLHGGRTKGRDLMKYTFAQLVKQEQLAMPDINIADTTGENEGTDNSYRYVEKGPLYDPVKAKMYEKPFLKPFEGAEEGFQLTLRHLVKLARVHLPSPGAYTVQVWKNSAFPEAFRQSLFQRVFNNLDFTDKGENMSLELEKEIDQTAARFTHLLKHNREEAASLAAALAANIYLFQHGYSDLLHTLDELIKKPDTADGGYHDSDFMLWGLLMGGDDSTHFDGGFDGGSDGGGEGGCSGCSGCGGCGG